LTYLESTHTTTTPAMPKQSMLITKLSCHTIKLKNFNIYEKVASKEERGRGSIEIAMKTIIKRETNERRKK